jgi:cell shape-determining protein MreC
MVYKFSTISLWLAVTFIFYLLLTSDSTLAVNRSINNTLSSLTDIMHNIQVDVHHIAKEIKKD